MTWEKSQEPRTKFIKTLEDVHIEFETTFQELLERTDPMTVLQGVGFTIAARAFTTRDPVQAMNEFRVILAKCYGSITNLDTEYPTADRPCSKRNPSWTY